MTQELIERLQDRLATAEHALQGDNEVYADALALERETIAALQSQSARIAELEGENAALKAALSPKRAHHEIARIKKLAHDPEVAAYIDELELLWRYQQGRTDAWRGIASAMGYEPLAHNDVKPTSPWLLARIAKFRASLTKDSTSG